MFENWIGLINFEELSSLSDFVESVKNGEPLKNNFAIIVGDFNTGKSTLLQNIIAEIGESNMVEYYCKHSDISNDLFENNKLENKLIIFDNENLNHNANNNLSSIIKNVISREKIFIKKELYQPKKEIVPKSNVILVTGSLDRLDTGLLQRAIIINLTHKFNKF